GACADDDPGRYRVPLQLHLVEDRLGDVVVAAPVGGAFSERELVEVVAGALVGETAGLVVDGGGVVDQVAGASLGLDQGDLLLTGGGGHDRDERQPQEPGEVGLGYGGGAARGLDDGRALADPAVAEAVEEERAGEAMLQRPGRVDGLVLQV